MRFCHTIRRSLPALAAGIGFLQPALLMASDETAAFDRVFDFTRDESEELGTRRTDASGNEWLIAPIPSFSPTFGWTLAVPVARLYRPKTADPDSPAWMTGIGGFAAENGSWGAGLFHRMNLQNDKWRILAGLAYSDLVYNYYGIGNIGGDRKRYLEIYQDFTAGLVEGLYALKPGLFVGLRVFGTQTTVHDIRLGTDDANFLDPVKGLQMNIITLDPKIVYDTRDNEFYPHSGTLAKFQVDLSRKSLGSDFDYSLYKLEWNHYRSLADNQVLAIRVAGKYAAGKAPFFLLPAMGQGGDLRGYETGVYRDRLLMATQAEYRLRLTDRFGVVAFAGIGTVGPGFEELDETLPSYGGGIRWVLAKENDISLRVDIGWGKDNSEVYVGVGEAF